MSAVEKKTMSSRNSRSAPVRWLKAYLNPDHVGAVEVDYALGLAGGA
jgi:hypothetical protein